MTWTADFLPDSAKPAIEAAITAVWHWKFMPARRGGEAVEGTVVVPIRFRLGADDAG